MLKYEVKSVWEQTDAKKQKIMRDFAKKYMKFISENKTERECVAAALKRLQEAGFCSDFETGKSPIISRMRLIYFPASKRGRAGITKASITPEIVL